MVLVGGLVPSGRQAAAGRGDGRGAPGRRWCRPIGRGL